MSRVNTIKNCYICYTLSFQPFRVDTLCYLANKANYMYSAASKTPQWPIKTGSLLGGCAMHYNPFIVFDFFFDI